MVFRSLIGFAERQRAFQDRDRQVQLAQRHAGLQCIGETLAGACGAVLGRAVHDHRARRAVMVVMPAQPIEHGLDALLQPQPEQAVAAFEDLPIGGGGGNLAEAGAVRPGHRGLNRARLGRLVNRHHRARDIAPLGQMRSSGHDIEAQILGLRRGGEEGAQMVTGPEFGVLGPAHRVEQRGLARLRLHDAPDHSLLAHIDLETASRSN